MSIVSYALCPMFYSINVKQYSFSGMVLEMAMSVGHSTILVQSDYQMDCCLLTLSPEK